MDYSDFVFAVSEFDISAVRIMNFWNLYLGSQRCFVAIKLSFDLRLQILLIFFYISFILLEILTAINPV